MILVDPIEDNDSKKDSWSDEEDQDSEEESDDQSQIDAQQILNQIQESCVRNLQDQLERVQKLIDEPTNTPEVKVEAEKLKTEILQKRAFVRCVFYGAGKNLINIYNFVINIFSENAYVPSKKNSWPGED